SGIPEVKTILLGSDIKGFLTSRALLATSFGLCLAVGSGLPVGKEGPFVHIACIIAKLLLSLPLYKQFRKNKSFLRDTLSAACAVGVSSTFAAPIGGVLFSIEVTAIYFPVRNYWRGFFAAVSGSIVFRFFAFWFADERTITAVFTTKFDRFPYDAQELLVFLLIGAFSGLFAALFICLHAKVVELPKTLNFFSVKDLKIANFLYSLLIVIVISSLKFPHLLGPYMGLPSKEVIDQLFDEHSLAQQDIWKSPNIFASLFLYFLLHFVFTAFSVSLPFPAGVFVPVFTIGATFGRLVGEIMLALFPNGIHSDEEIGNIIPGGYAVVGAAAFSAAVTHTISTSVVVFELTGQITHIIPVMLAVLIADGLAHALKPSFYESMIKLKKLSYLPSISGFYKGHHKSAGEVMRKVEFYIDENATIKHISYLLQNSSLLDYPLVTSNSLNLIGAPALKVDKELMAELMFSEDDQDYPD
ncbi:hypothetical protein Zmor_008876, partial [Zophobas morio]